MRPVCVLPFSCHNLVLVCYLWWQYVHNVHRRIHVLNVKTKFHMNFHEFLPQCTCLCSESLRSSESEHLEAGTERKFVFGNIRTKTSCDLIVWNHPLKFFYRKEGIMNALRKSCTLNWNKSGKKRINNSDDGTFWMRMHGEQANILAHQEWAGRRRANEKNNLQEAFCTEKETN